MGQARTNRKVIRALEFALQRVDFQLRGATCGVPIEHQEGMRLYLDTWAAAPLREALEFLKGEREIFQMGDWR